MVKRLKIVVAWSSRKATLKECTESFLIFLERLKLFDSRLSIWYEGANSKQEAMKNKMDWEYDYIKNRFCRDCDDDDYPEFSFDIGFWNGASAESESVSISVMLGGEAKVGNNNCILTLPFEGKLFEHYCQKTNFDKLKELVINHWNPEKIMDEKSEWEML